MCCARRNKQQKQSILATLLFKKKLKLIDLGQSQFSPTPVNIPMNAYEPSNTFSTSPQMNNYPAPPPSPPSSFYPPPPDFDHFKKEIPKYVSENL